MCDYDNKGHKVYTDMDRFGVGVHISDMAVRYISDSLYTCLRSGCHYNRFCYYNEIHRNRYQTRSYIFFLFRHHFFDVLS